MGKLSENRRIMEESRFFEDEVIKGYNEKLGRIIQFVIPKVTINLATEELSFEYDEETTEALNEVKAAIAEYMKNYYPMFVELKNIYE